MAQRDATLVIKARDETQRAINSAKTAMERFAAAQEKTARRRSFVAGQKEELAGLLTQLESSQAATQELGRRMGDAARPSKKLRDEFNAQREATRKLKEEIRAKGAAYITTTRQQQGSFAIFDQTVQRLNRETTALNVNAAAQTRNSAARRKSAGGDLVGGIVDAYSSRQGRGPLGLRPHEFQNFTYQINDLITQVASGTPVRQAFAQQAGQIIQLFPKAAAAALRFAPAVGAVVTVLLALKRVGDIAALEKGFEVQLLASADAAAYNAAALSKTAQELYDYRGSLEQAKGVLRTFMAEGVQQDDLKEFGLLAADMAKVLGIDVAEAATTASTAFTGSLDSVRDLDKRLNILTASELEQVEALFKAGRAEEARALAFEKARAKFAAGAAEMRGPWTQAAENFATAWDNLLDAIGNSSVIKNTITEIGDLARMLEYLTSKIPGAQRALSDGAAGGGTTGLVQRRPDVGGVADVWRQSGQMPIGQMLFGNLGWTRPAWSGGRTPGQNSEGRVQITPEIRAIVATVLKEARSDPAYQRDVAAVILNRMQRTGQSAQAVVTAPWQFEGAGNAGTPARRDWERINENTRGFAQALEAILPILEGTMADPTNGATLYYAPEAQRDLGRKTPAWADPAKMTAERGGHRFYTGAFPGAQGDGGPAGPTEDQLKAQRDILRVLEDQRTATLDLTDAERVRQAGLTAMRAAQDAGQPDSFAQQAKAYAEDTERLRIAQEQNKVQAEFRQQLADTIKERTFELSLVGKTNREIAVARALHEQETQALEAKTVVTAEQRAEIVRSTTALYDAEEAERVRVATAQAALELAQAKGEVETRDAYISRRMAEEEVDANNALADSYRTILGLLYDVEAAQRAREEIEKRVADLSSLQQETMQAIEFARGEGDAGAVAALQVRLAEVNAAYREAMVAALAFWQTQNIDDPAVQGAIAALERNIATVDALGRRSITTAAEINQVLVGDLMSGWSGFWSSIEQGASAFDAAKDSFLGFAASFLSKIAEMIAQAYVLKLLNIDASGNSLGGGKDIGGTIAGFITGLFGVKHQGGMVGGGGPSRRMPLAAFAGATRYHSGGMIGFKPNERPIIAEVGEEMLTADDPRHRNNLGKGGAGGGSTKIVNVFDPAELLEAALATEAGERVIINYVQRNSGAFKAALG